MLICKTVKCKDCGFSGHIKYDDEKLDKYNDIQFCPICSGNPITEQDGKYKEVKERIEIAIMELKKLRGEWV